jgi:hypothetical protein
MSHNTVSTQVQATMMETPPRIDKTTRDTISPSLHLDLHKRICIKNKTHLQVNMTSNSTQVNLSRLEPRSLKTLTTVYQVLVCMNQLTSTQRQEHNQPSFNQSHQLKR